jgi:hypothetical protein
MQPVVLLIIYFSDHTQRSLCRCYEFDSFYWISRRTLAGVLCDKPAVLEMKTKQVLKFKVSVIFRIYVYIMGPDRVVVITTSYGLDVTGIESFLGGELFRTCPNLSRWPTEPYVRWVPSHTGGLSLALITHPHLALS